MNVIETTGPGFFDPDNSLPLAIFLMGPTASGKTSLALELVKHLPCDIISVDSSLVYRGMNIGSAKPDKATLAVAPHRLIDIRDPSEPYSAADFRRDALREMQEITASGRIPLLVGGSMLYFKVLLSGMAPLPGADQSIRDRIQAEADEFGWPGLHDRLGQFDPVAAGKIHPNNPQRLMRALEVYAIRCHYPTKLLTLPLFRRIGPNYISVSSLDSGKC